MSSAEVLYQMERALLSSMLQRPEIIPDVADRIGKIRLSHPEHRELYLTLLRMWHQSMPIDTLTVPPHLSQLIINDDRRPFILVAEIYQTMAAPDNYRFYADHLIQANIDQEALDMGKRYLAQVKQDRDQAVHEMLHNMQVIQSNPEGITVKTYRESLGECFSALDRQSKGDGYDGLKTNFKDLDRKLGGLQKGNLIILAARPSMGKSMFALNIAENLSVAQTHPGIFFSLEMTETELINRTLSRFSRVPVGNFCGNNLSDEDWCRIHRTVPFLERGALLLNDRGNLSMMEIRNYCRKVKNLHGLDYIVIDYLSLIAGEDSSENENLRLGKLTRELKALAKDFDIPVICIAQLNRAVEGRTDKRPTMADIRQSGEIEQNADIVLLLYREDYYKTDPIKKNHAELIIAKHRNGQTGELNLYFYPATMEFTEHAQA